MVTALALQIKGWIALNWEEKTGREKRLGNAKAPIAELHQRPPKTLAAFLRTPRLWEVEKKSRPREHGGQQAGLSSSPCGSHSLTV